MVKFKKVAVLMGGGSSEAEISMLSGRGVAAALREAGCEVHEVVLDKANRFTLPEGTEAAFIMLHGAYGEDGGVQADLQRAGVPYVGSDVESSRVSFDKTLSRAAFAAAGVPIPEGYVIAAGEDPGDEPRIPLPVVVKPPRQGSSVGVTIVRDLEGWHPAVDLSRAYDQDVIVEKFIPGREWSVAILDNEALPPMEIRPKTGWYDWRNKYADDAGTSYEFPQDNPAEAALVEKARAIALAAYHAVGGRGMGRIDARVTPEGEIFVLENNSIPGCTAHSILPKAAAKVGISFSELCVRVLNLARC